MQEKEVSTTNQKGKLETLDRLFDDEKKAVLVGKIERLMEQLPQEMRDKRDTPNSPLWSKKDVLRLVDVMGEFALTLAPHLHEYSSILGDDSSGRLPALFVWHLSKELNQKHKLLKNAPPLHFVGLQTLEIITDDREKFSEADVYRRAVEYLKMKKLGPKTLLITEYVYSGTTARLLASIVEEAGSHVGIGAISSENKNTRLPDSISFMYSLVGGDGRDLFEFTYSPDERDELKNTSRGGLSGVVKTEDVTPDGSAGIESHAEIRRGNDGRILSVAREVMKILAEASAEEIAKKVSEL